MAPLILLAPNCGAGVGLGHLERMLALADVLAEKADVVVLTGGVGPEAERVRARGHQSHSDSRDWPQRAADAVAELHPAVAVLDGYGLDVATQADIRGRSKLVVVDDTSGECACDILVNPAPGAESIPVAGSATQVLAGAPYALLAQAYLEGREARRREGADPGSIALVTGGANFGDLQGQLLGALREALPEATIHVAVGPRSEAPAPAANLVIHPAATTLAPLLARSEMYVGSAGGGAVQAACVGVPAVVMAIVDNQAAQARALAEGGCAMSLPIGSEPSDAAALARALAADGNRRTLMSAAGPRLVDGLGAERVAGAILELAGAGRPA